MRTSLLRTKQGSESLWFLSQRNPTRATDFCMWWVWNRGAVVLAVEQGRTRRPAQALNLGVVYLLLAQLCIFFTGFHL